MLCYAQTLVLEKIRSGELLHEALQKQKFERQQKRKNEMVEQRLCMKELKSNLSTGDMKGVFIYPLFFTEIDKKRNHTSFTFSFKNRNIYTHRR